jgi:hypothetical protein
MFPGMNYQERTTEIIRGGRLILYTDGLPDSIRADDPEARIRDAATASDGNTLTQLGALVDPRLNADDVTMVLVRRV